MKELEKNLYKVILTNKKQRTSLRNLYIIKGSDRSLMIDTSWKEEECLRDMKKALEELSIPLETLDIFVTHNHADHSGYVSYFTDHGARALMSPVEISENSDRYHRFFLDAPMRRSYISQTGAKKELDEGIWRELTEGADRLAKENTVDFRFPFTPVFPGELLTYGDYTLQVLPLPGHTAGQCGLVEHKKKLLFCADQVISGLVPIVITSGKDQHLLKSYFESLDDLSEHYQGYRFLPGHYGEFTEIRDEVSRIKDGYEERCSQLRLALAESQKPMTLLELDRALYVQRHQTYQYSYFFSYQHTWPKLFSCLDYLADIEKIVRTEKDGVLYWSLR